MIFLPVHILEAIDFVDQYVKAYKIGSGDITWTESIEKICGKNKPVILATGASSIDDVKCAVESIRRFKIPYSIMQCNTNYTAADSNYACLNVNVLKTYARMFPNVF